MVEPPDTFPELLRWLRQRAGLSQNRLARLSGIDPAYVHRMETAAGHEPLVPRAPILERLCDVLDLSRDERDRLYFAARRCPPSLAASGRWEPLVGELARVLADPALGPDDRAELRAVLLVLLDRWRRSAAAPGP